jgi:hypothetical protein
MARLGSVAAAPFLGGEFVSLYLGAERVPTVPGKPVIVQATFVGLEGVDCEVFFNAPSSDGGSAIVDNKIYWNGVEVSFIEIDEDGVVADFLATIELGDVGDVVRISAVNAVGEGPLSAPFTVTAS